MIIITRHQNDLNGQISTFSSLQGCYIWILKISSQKLFSSQSFIKVKTEWLSIPFMYLLPSSESLNVVFATTFLQRNQWNYVKTAIHFAQIAKQSYQNVQFVKLNSAQNQTLWLERFLMVSPLIANSKTMGVTKS